MATRTPRRHARSRRKSPRSAPARAARRRAPARRSPARVENRRRDPESLRLRSMSPTLTVNDLPRSLRFYTDVLGFVEDERWMDGTVLTGVSLKAGTCTISLTQDDWAKGRDRKKGQGLRLWCETVQDVDALAARIKEAGGQLAEEPQDQPWGVRSLTVDDPDGFRLSLYREQ